MISSSIGRVSKPCIQVDKSLGSGLFFVHSRTYLTHLFLFGILGFFSPWSQSHQLPDLCWKLDGRAESELDNEYNLLWYDGHYRLVSHRFSTKIYFQSWLVICKICFDNTPPCPIHTSWVLVGLAWPPCAQQEALQQPCRDRSCKSNTRTHWVISPNFFGITPGPLHPWNLKRTLLETVNQILVPVCTEPLGVLFVRK